jgi:nucleotide-binding universal stress UspA family protein
MTGTRLDSKTVAREKPSVLLALGERDCPWTSLERAGELARALGGALHVIRVVPGWPRLRSWLPKRFVFWLQKRERKRAVELHRATLYSLAGAYGLELPASQVSVHRGNLFAEIATHARLRDADWIVISPDVRRVGAIATRLALATGLRVLVPRPIVHVSPILAASDLATSGFPVLAEGARLGAVLRRSIVAFHDATTASAAEGTKSRGTVGGGGCKDPALRLHEAARFILTPCACAVSTEGDPASAILREATSLRADVVVVGVHRRSFWRRLFHGSVAARVVRRATCSVVVAPLMTESARS